MISPHTPLRALRWIAVATLPMLLGGCLLARVPSMVEAHDAAQRFPAKGDVDTAQKRSMVAGGQPRSWLVQTPQSGAALRPIVLVLHGGTQTAEDVWKQTSLPTLAASEGFILAAPQGVDKHWNDGRGSTIAGDAASTADDVKFLRDIVAELVLRDRGDARNVFVIGVSNGGFMAMYYACNAGDTLRAGANVISVLPQALSTQCRSTKPLPWLSMNGEKDPIMPFAGQAAGTLLRGKPQPALLSADATFKFWADRAHCAPAVSTQRVSDTVDKRVRTGCSGSASSEQYVFHNAGHVWPGQAITRPLLAYTLGGTNLDVDSGQTAWTFFKSVIAR